MKFEIGDFDGYYIYVYISDYAPVLYLLKDGTLETSIRAENHHKTREEAQTFLDSWLPRKEWLTIYDVRNPKSELESLDLSIEHWKQIVCADFEDLREAWETDKVSIGSMHCALCRYHKCDDCFLRNGESDGTCCREWRRVVRSEIGLFSNKSTDQQKFEFKKACIQMLNKLIEEKNKMTTFNIRGKDFSEETIVEALKKHCDFKEKVEKRTLRHGDFGYYAGNKNDPCIIENNIEDDTDVLSVTNEYIRCQFKLTQTDIDEFERVGNIFDILKKVANGSQIAEQRVNGTFFLL